MTFGYMLLTAAFVLCVCVASNAVEDRSDVRGIIMIAAGLVFLGTFILGVSVHWHNQDHHPAEREPVAEESSGP